MSDPVVHPNPKEISVLLIGNPNSGKTSLFNALTCSHQHVGNYPGVTVEKREGSCRFNEFNLHFIDLPGIYSLTSYSPEERITRDYIISHPGQVIVNVVDASNLERNLYLTVQLLEMGLNIVVALNMIDEIRNHGIDLDIQMMSKRLGCPVIPTSAPASEGVEPLKTAIISSHIRPVDDIEIHYRGDLGVELHKIVDKIIQTGIQLPFNNLFAAVKLLEQDEEVASLIRNSYDAQSVLEQTAESIHRLEDLYGDATQILIADRRYGFASGLYKEIMTKKFAVDRIDLTQRIDSIVTNRIAGIPVFLVVIYILFWLTFKLGRMPMDWIERLLHLTQSVIAASWPAGFSPLLLSLIIHGVLEGVGGVIVFLPNILILFAGISFLEDTGYLARVAFIMDKVMHKIDLHGRSFIPLLIGFGCTVPAIMAARTIRSDKTRITTIMILPLMSCGARLTIYLLIIPAFFPPAWQASMLWLIYLIGVGLALGIAKLLRKTIFAGEAEPFVMELPPYRLPGIRAVGHHMWEKAWQYLKKASTVILGVSIILWALSTFPQKTTFETDQKERESIEYSALGRIGKFISPALHTMGFDWKIGTAFIGALAAKEVFVSQLAIIHALEDADQSHDALRKILRRNYSPLIGFCILIFALIALPCSSTFAVVRKETGAWRWAAVQWAGLTTLGWIITSSIYRIGLLFIA